MSESISQNSRKMACLGLTVSLVVVLLGPSPAQDLLVNLGKPQDYISKRVSSYDRTGGNNDRLTIPSGETAVLAEIAGPGAIHHIWVTIAAEPFYGRKIILRMYWDGEETPSVEAPIGDFFGVGHGLDRSFSSLPINCSSEGRARNCYWFMPFRKSARITATNEGSRPVGAFYYYIDYRELPELPPDTPTFHAQYRQEMPCTPGQNYLILEAAGRGHYVGCCLSVLQRAMGWWGEGDDMIFIDGEESPSLYGTGSEDYFSDAWGMREDENPFYGCPLQEPDFRTGAKASVYRFHIPDPIPFRKSIRVTIEHGHANDRSDFYSSVAFWYQTEPHRPFPELTPAVDRLPFALETRGSFVFPSWEEDREAEGKSYVDKGQGLVFTVPHLTHFLTSFYTQRGERYPVLMTENAGVGTTAALTFRAQTGERYNIDLYFLKGPEMGNVEVPEVQSAAGKTPINVSLFEGYAPERKVETLTLRGVRLYPGKNTLALKVAGKADAAQGLEMAFVGLSLIPSDRRFLTAWNLIGPFEAPDMTHLLTTHPPEEAIDFARTYRGKEEQIIGWREVTSEESGFVPLASLLQPNEKAVAYALTYVHSPETMKIDMLVGSDDGVRVWLNGRLVHTNAAYRGAYPDQDHVTTRLEQGWNTVLVKVLQGGGGWGFYLRFVDPDRSLRWSPRIPEKKINEASPANGSR